MQATVTDSRRDARTGQPAGRSTDRLCERSFWYRTADSLLLTHTSAVWLAGWPMRRTASSCFVCRDQFLLGGHLLLPDVQGLLHDPHGHRQEQRVRVCAEVDGQCGCRCVSLTPSLHLLNLIQPPAADDDHGSGGGAGGGIDALAAAPPSNAPPAPLAAGAIVVVVRLCWCNCAGAIVLVRLCWCNCAGAIVLVQLCWCNYAGAIVLVQLCW